MGPCPRGLLYGPWAQGPWALYLKVFRHYYSLVWPYYSCGHLDMLKRRPDDLLNRAFHSSSHMTVSLQAPMSDSRSTQGFLGRKLAQQASWHRGAPAARGLPPMCRWTIGFDSKAAIQHMAISIVSGKQTAGQRPGWDGFGPVTDCGWVTNTESDCAGC